MRDLILLFLNWALSMTEILVLILLAGAGAVFLVETITHKCQGILDETNYGDEE